MSRLIVAGFALFLGSVLAAQPSLPARSTLGLLSGQQFRIDDHVWLSVEYGASGMVCAAVIAPSNYRAESPVAENSMDSKVVDQVLEVILPGILADERGMALMSTMSRNSFLDQQYQGARLRRHFLGTDNGKETVVATLQTTAPCRTSNAATLQAHYGWAQAEQFSAAGNMTIGVRYGANRIPWRMDFNPTRPAGAVSASPALLNAIAVEHWISTLTSTEGQSGRARHYVSWSGSRKTETDTYQQVSIERSYQEGTLIQASITWK